MYIKNNSKEIVDKDSMFIVTEGLDGSGKSTIAQILAIELDGIYYKTPMGYYQKIRSEVDNNRDFIEHFLFYLASVRYASQQIKELLKTKIVICDRYIFSTLAYHNSLGVKIKIDVEKLELAIPDYTFYLQVSADNQLKRIKNRNNTTFADDWIIKQKIHNRLNQEFKKFPMCVIETDNKQPMQVVDEIKSIIKGGLK